MADVSEVGDHSGAVRGVVEEGAQGSGYVFCGEAVLQEFGDNAAAGDEVCHRDREVGIGVGLGLVPDFGGILNEALGQTEGERGDSVDDDEGVADDGCLDGCGAAGDDAGAGVMEGFAGVGDEGDRTF